MPKCEDCRYWEKVGPVTGRCKRSSPAYDAKYIIGIWPEVLYNNWCGEYKAKEEG